MHDPATAPDPDAWLAMEELARSEAMAAWHTANPNPVLHGEVLNADLHASLHAAVETQIATGEPPVVADTVRRLAAEGVNRHAAVHAVMECFVFQMHQSLGTGEFDLAAYALELAKLEAATIIARGMRRAAASQAHPPTEEPDTAPRPNRRQRRAAKKRR